MASHPQRIVLYGVPVSVVPPLRRMCSILMAIRADITLCLKSMPGFVMLCSYLVVVTKLLPRLAGPACP